MIVIKQLGFDIWTFPAMLCRCVGLAVQPDNKLQHPESGSKQKLLAITDYYSWHTGGYRLKSSLQKGHCSGNYSLNYNHLQHVCLSQLYTITRIRSRLASHPLHFAAPTTACPGWQTTVRASEHCANPTVKPQNSGHFEEQGAPANVPVCCCD